MKPKGLDMGDYEERYQAYDIEVAVEQDRGAFRTFNDQSRWNGR